MPKVIPRTLSPGEISELQRLAAWTAQKEAKVAKRRGGNPPIIMPPRNRYGGLWSAPDNE